MIVISRPILDICHFFFWISCCQSRSHPFQDVSVFVNFYFTSQELLSRDLIFNLNNYFNNRRLKMLNGLTRP